MDVTISVILPTHDRPDRLRRTIATVLDQDVRPYEIIVVNDGQIAVPEDLAGKARKAGVRWIVRDRQPPSLPAGRNLGLDLATGDVSLMLEDDALLPPGYLRRLGRLWHDARTTPVAAIGSRIVEPHTFDFRGRLWQVLESLSAHGRWQPRKCAARYVELPPVLRRRLQPAGRLPGAGTSLRTEIARAVRYDESLPGYAYGEDREFSFRLSREYPVYVAPELAVVHRPGRVTPVSLGRKGRTYVANSLRIARRCTEGGAGLWAMLAMDFLGTLTMYAGLSLVGKNRRARWAFARGIAVQLLIQITGGITRRCGR